MRVVVVTPHLPPIVGGISTFSREMIAELSARKVEVWAFGRQGAMGPNREVVHGSSLRFVWRVYLAIWKLQPQAVHVHSHWYALLPGVMYRAVRPSTRLVFTFHTQPVERRLLAAASLRILLALCTSITYVSRELQARFQPLLRTHQVVTYPAPEPHILENTEPQEGLIAEKIRGRTSVVCVGPLVWPLKVEGVRRLVEAFQMVAPSHQETVLVIIGDGPLRQNLEAFSSDRLGDLVIFTGTLENVAPTVIASRVYAQISLQEGLPISLLNAMALGKAVLATAVGGMPEVVRDGETGVLVQPEVEKIAEALDRLLSDPELCSSLGAAAARDVRALFTWQRTVDQFLDCYEAPS